MALGAYTLVDASSGIPKVVIVATGSEVSVAVEAREILEAEAIPTRVVSAPCLEWYATQPKSYKQALIPESVVVVSIEAGVTTGWAEIIGWRGRSIGIDHFGASASPSRLFTEYGITPIHVVDEAKAGLAELDLG
jgi:transketolase